MQLAMDSNLTPPSIIRGASADKSSWRVRQRGQHEMFSNSLAILDQGKVVPISHQHVHDQCLQWLWLPFCLTLTWQRGEPSPASPATLPSQAVSPDVSSMLASLRGKLKHKESCGELRIIPWRFQQIPGLNPAYQPAY